MAEARKGTKGSATAGGVHLKLSKEQVALARTIQRSIKVEGEGRNGVRARLITACLFVVTDMTNEALENDEDWEGGGLPLQAYYMISWRICCTSRTRAAWMESMHRK